MIKHLIEYFVPKRATFDDEIYRRDRIAVNIAFFAVIYCIINMTVSTITGVYFNLYSFIPVLIILVTALFIFRNTGNIVLSVNLIAISATFRLVPNIYLLGGINSVSAALLLILPVVVFLLLGNKAGLVWMSINMLIIVIFYFIFILGKKPTLPVFDNRHALFNMFVLIALLFLVTMAVRTFELITVRARRELARKNTQLARSIAELKTAQAQLVQAEKMASLGQLTAGVAHEINNPINFISGNINPLRRDIGEIMKLLEGYASLDKNSSPDKLAEILKHRDEIDLSYTINEIRTLVNGIEAGSKRTAEIVDGLRNFSRLDEGDLKESNVNEGIESTLILLHSKLEENKIEIEKQLGDVPQIDCYPGQLNQVVLHMLNNAVDAIGQNGKIIITTSADDDFVIISIRDTGKGMANEVKEKIFEPFFTTKDVGKGTGLGLSIAYGIVEKHSGRIEVVSEENKGSEFIIMLPIN